nr:MAG TPA: Minor Head Virion Protein G6P [Inoviridae sp.]
MPILPIIATFLGSIVSGLVFRALASLGFAYVSYVGIGYLIDQVDGYVKTLFGAVPPPVAAILGMAKLDVAINIILAAVIARLLLAGMDKVTGTITGLALLNKVGG